MDLAAIRLRLAMASWALAAGHPVVADWCVQMAAIELSERGTSTGATITIGVKLEDTLFN